MFSDATATNRAKLALTEKTFRAHSIRSLQVVSPGICCVMRDPVSSETPHPIILSMLALCQLALATHVRAESQVHLQPNHGEGHEFAMITLDQLCWSPLQKNKDSKKEEEDEERGRKTWRRIRRKSER